MSARPSRANHILTLATFATFAALAACGDDADVDRVADTAGVADTSDMDAFGGFDEPDEVEADGADGDAESDPGDAAEGDTADGDLTTDRGVDDDSGDEVDAGDVGLDDADGSGDTSGPERARFRRFATRPTIDVLPDDIESCPVYHETRCVDGVVQECVLRNAGVWADSAPRLVEQAYMFDRYYDLYHEIEGMTVDLRFTRPIPQGTPESEWSAPDVFLQMDAYGDASGWTGTALLAAAARFQATGTSADYERMLEKFEGMMFLYEVTGIPGMIARSHFALLEDGAPPPIGQWGKALSPWFSDDGSGWHYHYAIAPEHLARLPEYYTAGVELDGGRYDTLPRWMGDSSRDMYVRSMPGIMLAYEMLGSGEREDRLRAVLREQLPCTLNRMKMGRIENLQSRPDLIEAVSALLGSGSLTSDPEDLDFTTLDTLVMFFIEQPNPAHPELFDPTCPDGPPMTADPEFVLDAEDPAFVFDMLELFGRVDRSADAPIAWFQAPSVRAADLVFMLQWAYVAEYLTGDSRYLDFVDMLAEDIDFEGVLLTWGSYQLPKWCQAHFAPSLGYPSLYNLRARLAESSALSRWLARAATEELRNKEMLGRDDSYFGVMYGQMFDPSIDPTGAAYASEAAARLEQYGIDPANPAEPDRNIARDLLDREGLEPLSAEDRAICETPITVLGLDFGAPGLPDEDPRSIAALPLSLRTQSGFLWTGDPWDVLYQPGAGENTLQFPMLGMTTPFWLGRADGIISDGALYALGWRATADSCE